MAYDQTDEASVAALDRIIGADPDNEIPPDLSGLRLPSRSTADPGARAPSPDGATHHNSGFGAARFRTHLGWAGVPLSRRQASCVQA